MPHPRAWRPFILVASYTFYGWVDWRWVLLLISSTLVNTVAARVIAQSPSDQTRKRALTAAIVFDLGLLCVFKYLGFFTEEVDGALGSVGLGSPLPLVQVVLPIGISFFTFQAISYVVDVYRGEPRAGQHLARIARRSQLGQELVGPDDGPRHEVREERLENRDLHE